MEFVTGIVNAFWEELKALYNIYLMLLGMGIGAFCYLIDGNSYKKKGFKKETIAAKAAGLVLFISAVGLYILVLIF